MKYVLMSSPLPDKREFALARFVASVPIFPDNHLLVYIFIMHKYIFVNPQPSQHIFICLRMNHFVFQLVWKPSSAAVPAHVYLEFGLWMGCHSALTVPMRE